MRPKPIATLRAPHLPFSPSPQTRAWRTGVASLAAGLVLGACSVDVIPVHPSRVNAVKAASAPIARGPNAPGYFKKTWTFQAEEGGYLYDPTRIEITAGVVGLKALSPYLMQRKRLKPEFRYGRDRAVVETAFGARFLVLDTFRETLGPGNQGFVRYQLSPNGTAWYFHNGDAWVSAGAGPDQGNSAAEIQSRISVFDQEVGRGSLRVRLFLFSKTGAERAEVQSIEVEGISPKSDHWD